MGRKTLGILGIVLIAAVAVGFLFKAFQRPMGMALANRTIAARMDAPPLAGLSDGLHVGLCGSGSPFPDPTRAGPCSFVLAGDQLFIVDTGSGSSRQLGAMGVPLDQVDGILLTHFHSDHITDLGDVMMLRWATRSSETPVPIYGPPGVAQVVEGFQAAYGLDRTYRIAHHGAAIVPPSGFGGTPVEISLGTEDDASALVLESGDLRITMFRVAHNPIDPAVGYRFDYKGRSVVLSGDTSYTQSLVHHAAGADLLLHDGLQPALVSIIGETAEAHGDHNIATIMVDIQDYHATPEDAARAASEADVDALVLTHIVPPLPSRLLYPAYLGDADAHYDGPITVGEDGMVFSLPPGSEEIERSRF